MKFCHFLTVLFFVKNCCFGQTNENHDQNFVIRLSPLSIIDVYNGGNLKFGTEIKLFQHTSIAGDFGYYFTNFSGRLNMHGFNVYGELKHYLQHKNDGNIGMYLSLNAFYKEQQFDFIDHLVADESISVRIQTEKFVGYTGINFGYVDIKKRLVLDYFCGLGVRFKQVNSNFTEKDFNDFVDLRDSQAGYFIFTPGTFILPNFSLGIRIGWRIK